MCVISKLSSLYLCTKTTLSVEALCLNGLGLDTELRYRHRLKKYHIVPFDSFKLLLTILNTVRLSFIRDWPGP